LALERTRDQRKEKPPKRAAVPRTLSGYNPWIFGRGKR
jgi:hypothetical protein